MFLLADLFPFLRRYRMPISRDRAVLYLMALMEVAMAVEVYSGHLISGTIVPNEWIPIIFGPIAGAMLVVADIIRKKRRDLALSLVTIAMTSSIVVGLLGLFFHLRRALLPAAPAGEQFSVDLLIWAPPVIAPLMFALVGVLGLSAAFTEDPHDSGILTLPRGIKLRMPYSKTQAFFFWVGLAMLATTASGVLDHARAEFANPWLWFPTVLGIAATVITIILGFEKQPSRGELAVYVAALVLMMLAGPLGMYFHILADLTARGEVVFERLIKGAPVMAPLLYSNMALLGGMILWDARDS
ncbi:MAG: hypothetical protein ABFQ89_05110 [Chloroflexota bacterium]